VPGPVSSDYRPNAPYLCPSTLPQTRKDPAPSTWVLALPPQIPINLGLALPQTDPMPPGTVTVTGPGLIPDKSQPQPRDLSSHACRLHSVSSKSSEIHSHPSNSFLWNTYHIPSTGNRSSPWGLPRDVNNHANNEIQVLGRMEIQQ